MEPAANLSVDVQPGIGQLGLSMQIEPALSSRLMAVEFH
jgi:hypothetical protein